MYESCVKFLSVPPELENSAKNGLGANRTNANTVILSFLTLHLKERNTQCYKGKKFVSLCTAKLSTEKLQG